MNRFVITALLICSTAAFGGNPSVQDQSTKVSIKTFGAKGDGVTDDTAAIQTGLNAACGASFTIATTSGAGVSPIVITTTAPHTFLNGSSVTVAGVGGNADANGSWVATVLSPSTVALYSQNGDASTGNATYTSGGTIAAVAPNLYFPAGTYNISSPLVTGCAISLSGDGPTQSIIFQTHQYTSIHGVVANYSLSMQDMAINTTPLTVDYGMIAVFAGTSSQAAPMLGYTFSFVRFNSSGFNFGLDINGTSETDLLDSITVSDCNISVGTKANAVSQPINAANAVMLTVTGSTLTGDSLPDGAIHNDHAIDTLAVRGVLIRNNLIQNHGNSAIKLLQGGFHSASCPTIQNYTSWTIDNNRIVGSRLAIAVYSYCALVMPSIVISNNLISNIPNTYLGDYAAVYVQSNCQSNMAQVASSSNTFTNLGLGGIVLASQVESDATCTATAAQGTISNFSSTGDTFVNWSLTSAGTFPAINSTGQNLIHASVAQLNADGSSNGNVALNLSAFTDVNVADTTK
jgi:hypothetical protein